MKAVNLLPSEQRGSVKPGATIAAKPVQEGAPVGAYAVLGGLALAVAAAAAVVLTGNTVTERQAELARVSAEAQAVQARATSLQAFADFEGLATQRVSTVKGLAQSRFDWQRSMGDLARALPADVHLRSLDGSTGAAGAATGVQAPSIQLSGCTTSQVAVADLMSRLRNVRGVTRVALAQSQKVDAQAGATVTGTGDRLCPKGSPPDFDLTIFFERAALPAGAAVNPGAAAVAPGAPAAPAATPAAPGAPAATATPAAAGQTASATTTTGATK